MWFYVLLGLGCLVAIVATVVVVMVKFRYALTVPPY